jgi:hypothetical protein
MLQKTKRDAVAYWEKRRIVYNFLLVPASLLAWEFSSELTYSIDEGTPARLTDPPVLFALVILCIGANLCYTFVYALEFLFLAESPSRFWPKPGRMIFLILGCLLGIWFASCSMSQIQVNMAEHGTPFRT